MSGAQAKSAKCDHAAGGGGRVFETQRVSSAEQAMRMANNTYRPSRQLEAQNFV